MTAILAWLASSRLGQALAALGALLAALGGAYLAGRNNATERAARREAEARAHAGEERAHADADAGRVADPAAELRKGWSRD